MPCLLVILALSIPRVTAVLIWLLTNWFDGVFDSLLWPVLGFIFMPTTLIWYVTVAHFYHGVWGMLQIIVLVATLAIDIGPWFRARRN